MQVLKKNIKTQLDLINLVNLNNTNKNITIKNKLIKN